MKVAYRMYVAVFPAVLGVLLVAALSYWGRYAHQAPETIVVLAGVAALASLVLGWRNTRYVAGRIEQIVAADAGLSALGVERQGDGARAVVSHLLNAQGPDELDSIANTLSSLAAEARASRAAAQDIATIARRRTTEYATMLSEAASALTARLDEVRMPLQVLAENHFGELNENQEEMIAAARAAADDATVDLGRLRSIADIDRGALIPRLASVHIADLVRSLVPQLRAQATAQNVRLDVTIEPDVPRIDADRERLRDALSLVVTDAIRYAVPGSMVTLHTWCEMAGQGSRAAVEVVYGTRHEHTGVLLLAQRLVSAQGGTMTDQEGRTRITFPVTAPANTNARSIDKSV